MFRRAHKETTTSSAIPFGGASSSSKHAGKKASIPLKMVASCLVGVTVGLILKGNPKPKPVKQLDTSRWALQKLDATTNKQGDVQLFPDTCASVGTIEKEFSDWYKDGTFAKMLPIETFYNNAEWPPKERRSASGPGSDLGYATKFSLEFLRKTIVEYGVKSMIDLPCGDNNWIFDARETDSLDMYIGLDIVQPLVELDKRRFAFHSNKAFRHWDGTTCPLPKFSLNGPNAPPQPADLIHSRDVLQHIGLQKGVDFLCNVFQSGAKLFVTTTFPNGENREITNGDFFLNDLTSPPYDMPKSTNCVLSHPDIERDLTCVYDLREAWVQPWIEKKCKGIWEPKKGSSASTATN